MKNLIKNQKGKIRWYWDGTIDTTFNNQFVGFIYYFKNG